MIEPDVDWYGTYARRSALGDYLELLALKGRSLSREELADRIRDNRWTRLLGERIGTPRPPEEEDLELNVELDTALERAGDVVSVLQEREATLGDRYPFELQESGRVTYRADSPEDSTYVRLLCITVAHATRAAVVPPPHEVFEGVVVSVLRNLGLTTVGIGERARAAGEFATVLRDSCEAVALAVYPERASARVFANDEGSDVLANLWTADPRSGGLQIVGQVTCARSDDWDNKMNEPSPSQWRAWLGGVPPVAFLAVPHHAEPATYSHLMERRERDLVDRLRLTAVMSDHQEPGEPAIVQHVLAQDVL